MDIDSDMAAAVNCWGRPSKGVIGLLKRGLGWIEARFRADPCKSFLAVFINWESYLWVSL